MASPPSILVVTDMQVNYYTWITKLEKIVKIYYYFQKKSYNNN